MVTLDLPSAISLLFSSLPSSFSRYEGDSDESKCTSQSVSLDVPSQSVATDFLQSIQRCTTTITGILP